jgi:hypothetical protein
MAFNNKHFIDVERSSEIVHFNYGDCFEDTNPENLHGLCTRQVVITVVDTIAESDEAKILEYIEYCNDFHREKNLSKTTIKFYYGTTFFRYEAKKDHVSVNVLKTFEGCIFYGLPIENAPFSVIFDVELDVLDDFIKSEVYTVSHFSDLDHLREHLGVSVLPAHITVDEVRFPYCKNCPSWEIWGAV